MPKQAAPVRRNLSQAVSEEILRWIRGGELVAGDRIPTERGLAELFGVGRNTVRGAVQGLVGIGVLDVRPGRGTVVRSTEAAALDPVTMSALLGNEAVDDLYELRLLIEVEIAARAAERAGADELAEIRAALARHRRAFARGHATHRA